MIIGVGQPISLKLSDIVFSAISLMSYLYGLARPLLPFIEWASNKGSDPSDPLLLGCRYCLPYFS